MYHYRTTNLIIKSRTKQEKLKKEGTICNWCTPAFMGQTAWACRWKQSGCIKGWKKWLRMRDPPDDAAIYAGWKKHSGNADFQYELCQSQRMRGYTGVYWWQPGSLLIRMQEEVSKKDKGLLPLWRKRDQRWVDRTIWWNQNLCRQIERSESAAS